MLLYSIFLQYIRIALANSALFNSPGSNLKRSLKPKLLSITVKTRIDDFQVKIPSCAEKIDTSNSPFVVLVLFKTSGRFLGLGAVIDKKTVLTALDVVRKAAREPHKLLVLAGSRSPWWGRYSQVVKVAELHYNDFNLVLMILRRTLRFDRNTKPIQMPGLPPPKNHSAEYGIHWAMFGIPRSSWDIPGDRILKTAVYDARPETQVQKEEDLNACVATYPEIEYNKTLMDCTYANSTLGWGCIGSPIVSVNPVDKMLLLGIIVKTTTVEADDYHLFVKPTHLERWITSFSHYSFDKSPKTY